MKTNCVKRFLEYVRVDTTSNPYSNTHPSSNNMFEFAEILVEDMKKLGLEDVRITDKCYVYGTLPANSPNLPGIGFIAHMDTSFDCSGKNVNPIVHKNYDGKDIVLNDLYTLKVSEYPFLEKMKGKTVITTDGTTLLGADDKAGICEILGLIEAINTNNFPHGIIKIAFTPDEEIGEGADFFDVEQFKKDISFAYTVDGGFIDEVEYENFNAASAEVTINGFNIHPGSAKDKMLNSIRIAYEFDALLPSDARPEKTEMYEGFNHLNNVSGNVEQTKLSYIIRNHDMNKFNEQKKDFEKAKEIINNKYKESTCELEIKDSYYNMAIELREKYGLQMVDLALQGIKNVLGFDGKTCPIRGGTDGARLTFMGLPCPNLGTGGANFHGRYECICAEDMDKMVEILYEITRLHQIK